MLEQQMSLWQVKYKANDQNIQKKFKNFWLKIGEKYCIDNKMKYIEE